jgi:FkbM family methyltransferase
MFLNIKSLVDLFDGEVCINAVDIGANPILGDGLPPYQTLLDAGHAKVVGFEPNPDALKILNDRKGPNELYLSHAVFDGTDQVLKVCSSQGMTSLLEPNTELLDFFFGFPEGGRVLRHVPVPTVRLDDVNEIKNIDLLKIDIQGGELEVFRNGMNRLKDCLVIQTEVNFLQMYKDQPLFSEVELFLRSQGFLFHKFETLHSRVVKPTQKNDDIYAGLSQVFWSDAIFVKDFTKLDLFNPIKLEKLALILNDIYGSFDLSMRALMACDSKAGTTYASKYALFFQK